MFSTMIWKSTMLESWT